jgi:ParB-like chromosome segregation protein Spo0J
MDSPNDNVADVPVGELRQGLSPRQHDADHVRVLADSFGDLPPILVHLNSMKVIDGIHRMHAAKLLGHPTIPCRFFDGTVEEALIEAIRANAGHSKPLTFREREGAAGALLRLDLAWSDRRIAKTCGLSPTTVGRIRSRVGADTGESRSGADGKRHPAHPSPTASSAEDDGARVASFAAQAEQIGMDWLEIANLLRKLP